MQPKQAAARNMSSPSQIGAHAPRGGHNMRLNSQHSLKQDRSSNLMESVTGIDNNSEYQDRELTIPPLGDTEMLKKRSVAHLRQTLSSPDLTSSLRKRDSLCSALPQKRRHILHDVATEVTDNNQNDKLAITKDQLAKELRKIREIANDVAQHYDNKKGSSGSQMQLVIKTNEDGTYEFIEQKRVV